MKRTFFAAMAFGTLLGLAACGGDSPRREAGPAVKVATVSAQRRSFSSTEAYVGNVKSRNAITISTKMMGRVQRIAVSEGEAVKKGQLLVEVDAAEARSAFQQSQAGLEAATVHVRNMERDFERFQSLFEKRAVTQQQLEQMEAGLAAAKAQEAQARANLEMSRTLLSYGRITASEPGLVTRKWMDEGNLAHPGAPILTLENPDSLELSVSVPQEKALALHPGQEAEVAVDTRGRTFRAPILSVVGAADPMSRTSTVKLDLTGVEGLRPGQFAQVRFQALAGEGLAVPEEALVRQGQMDGVYVAESGVARLRWVQAGRTSDGYVQILAGLREGDSVITPIPSGLRDGTPVEVSR